MIEQSEAITKPCTMCRESIPLDAKKCRHCQSDQRWLGRLGDWSLILSLLIALIAVIGAVAPIVKAAITPADARFEFGDVEVQPDAVIVRAKNVGGASAQIETAVITVPQRSAGQPYIYALGADRPADIAPGENRLLRFTFDRKEYDAPTVTAADSPCEIEIFDAHRRVSCDEVRTLGTALPPQDRRGGLPEEGPAPLPTPSRWERY